MPAAFEPYAILTVVNVILAIGVYITLTSGQYSVAHAASWASARTRLRC